MDEGASSSSRNVEQNEGEVEEASTSAPSLGNLHSHNVELFGPARDLDELSLPTAFDILKFYFFLADQIRNTNKIFTYKAFTPNVYDKLIEIWSKLNIDLLDKRAITKKLHALLDKHKEMSRAGRYLEKFESFVDGTKKIFFIAKCKCPLQTNLYNCGKIPDNLKHFIFDQHNDRTLSIPVVEDPSETEVFTIQPSLALTVDVTYQPTPSDLQDDTPMDVAHTSTESHYSPRYSLPKFAMMCDRLGVTSRVASCLAPALFEDIGWRDEHGRTIVCDKNKVDRERRKLRSDVLRRRKTGCLKAFSFDGRKDDALTQIKVGETYYSEMKKESHLVVVQEPNNQLLGYVHLAGKNDSAEAKHGALKEFFEEKQIPLDNLIGICSDGEVTNTGEGRGILRRFEKQLNRALHWWICLLHFNELPFRHLYETLEKSRSTGPRTSTGSLEKDLHNCHTQQVVTNFEAIPLENMPPRLDEDEEKKLSTDAKYLYKIANAISNGYVPTSLAMITPGPINHARWLTKACRILRLYATINTPSENLKILATYIMCVYVPMYFNVKYYKSVVYGIALLGKFIRWTQYLPNNLRRVINNTIDNNSYFAHCENILLSMLFDGRKHIRKYALEKIVYIRDNLFDPSLRAYVKPKINFDCTDYVHMINLNDNHELSEPPLTRGIPYEHLKAYFEDEDEEDPPLPDPNIPCHIQGTERYVQLVSNVSKRAIHKNREGIMATTVESRSKVSRMESKQDLQGNL